MVIKLDVHLCNAKKKKKMSMAHKGFICPRCQNNVFGGTLIKRDRAGKVRFFNSICFNGWEKYWETNRTVWPQDGQAEIS